MPGFSRFFIINITVLLHEPPFFFHHPNHKLNIAVPVLHEHFPFRFCCGEDLISVKCAAHFPLSNYVNSIFKSLDALYAEFAKNSGMPETAFYIMMAVHSEASECTQADICEKWAMSRQTVNSALKKLEKGLRYAREHIEPIFQFEKCAWEGLSEKQREQFLSLSKEYYQAFKAAMGQFYQSK